MAREKDNDQPKQPIDETGEWRKDSNGNSPETGGPVGIKVKCEPPGVVRVDFDRSVDTIVLQPLEAIMLCQALLQSVMVCARPRAKSKIIIPS